MGSATVALVQMYLYVVLMNLFLEEAILETATCGFIATW